MSLPQTPYFEFGAGYIYATAVGGQTATLTPRLLGTVQDASLEISSKTEALRGNLRFPDYVVASDMDIKGKITVARLDVGLFNDLIFGDSITTGIDIQSVKEAHSIPATSPYTVTITPPGSGTYDYDLGVRYAASGAAFVLVASGPTQGQYSVNTSTGVYTFAAADEGVAVQISYSYRVTTAGTQTLTVTNDLLGNGPICQLVFVQPLTGTNSVVVPQARLTSLKMPMKRAGFVAAEIDFEAFANAAGTALIWYQSALS